MMNIMIVKDKKINTEFTIKAASFLADYDIFNVFYYLHQKERKN